MHFFLAIFNMQHLNQFFQTGKAVCEGYALFVRELCKRTNVTSFQISPYTCQAKAFSWNQLKPPETPNSNHAAVGVVINGYKYLSEPCWGAGHLNSQHTFEPNYKPYQFLQPLICRLNDHFPMDETKKFLDFEYPYPCLLKVLNIVDMNSSFMLNHIHLLALIVKQEILRCNLVVIIQLNLFHLLYLY